MYYLVRIKLVNVDISTLLLEIDTLYHNKSYETVCVVLEENCSREVL